MDKMKRPLIVLTGPTAVGKTKLSIALAKAVNGEIISADSMQVYQHMDIGSAKIKPQEMDGVPHYLIDEISPFEEFNVCVFQKRCKQYMEEIYSRNHIPVIVGGTGFYIQAVTRDIEFEESDGQNVIRQELEELAAAQGAKKLHEMLQELDPAAAQEIHENNIKRVIRAIEYYRLTGTKISEHNEREMEKVSPYRLCYFVLNDDRARLYERIEQRIDEMLEEGLVSEVQKLKAMGCTKAMVSMQGLGYKEILSYLDGEISLEEAVYLIKRDTRHFAKRQLTWFRREKDTIFVDKQEFGYDEEKILAHMLSIVKEKLQ